MAGRFAFQKLAAASRMTRSTSRLVGAQASASSSRATAASFLRIAAPVMPRASEDGITTLSRFFHAAAVHPGSNNVVPSSISNHGGMIRGYGARMIHNTIPLSRPRVPVRRLKARMSASINNHKKSSALQVEEPWNIRLVAWASNRIKEGLNQAEIFLLKFFGLYSLMAAGIVIIAWNDDAADLARMVPSQSSHCSGCNCHSRR